jgi:hypothetical protein
MIYELALPSQLPAPLTTHRTCAVQSGLSRRSTHAKLVTPAICAPACACVWITSSPVMHDTNPASPPLAPNSRAVTGCATAIFNEILEIGWSDVKSF